MRGIFFWSLWGGEIRFRLKYPRTQGRIPRLLIRDQEVIRSESIVATAERHMTKFVGWVDPVATSVGKPGSLVGIPLPPTQVSDPICFHCNHRVHKKANCLSLSRGVVVAPALATLSITDERQVLVDAPVVRSWAFQLTIKEACASPNVVMGMHFLPISFIVLIFVLIIMIGVHRDIPSERCSSHSYVWLGCHPIICVSWT